MTSKQRAYLIGLAMKLDPVYNIGKGGISAEFTNGIIEVLEARELIKISVLKNCDDDPKELARIISERTHSEIVQVIGKKIVLYKESKENKKIELPKAAKPKNV
ncbi:MAG: ribosome assembly RNA-binding protein YhbY [Lachnospiraceae bacterium]|nr:ribosome assembly RNA-binding protein YhbY [Lachnospiraceae bacterium]